MPNFVDNHPLLFERLHYWLQNPREYYFLPREAILKLLGVMVEGNEQEDYIEWLDTTLIWQVLEFRYFHYFGIYGNEIDL